MKRILFPLILSIALLLAVGNTVIASREDGCLDKLDELIPQWMEQNRAPVAAAAKPASGCTVFTVSKGEQVFFGGNDDYTNPDSYYWVDPGDGKNYGAIWIGRPDNVQQGVNEVGLAYDANGLPRLDVNPHREREPVLGDYTYYPVRILHECATVEEVIVWVNTHQWHSYMHDQMHFADASGDAVVISAGADGEVAFTRKLPGDGFLVSTNFNVANPANGYGYPCWRYAAAKERLSELVSREGDLAPQDAATVLEAVHTEGGDYPLVAVAVVVGSAELWRPDRRIPCGLNQQNVSVQINAMSK